MQPDSINSPTYFDTPQRVERSQLLLHLVRNAGEVIYLRAPAGAGKTRFAERLPEHLVDGFVTVWLDAAEGAPIPISVIDLLGLETAAVANWPDSVLEAVAGRTLLLIVDHADELDLPAVESLDRLHAGGGRILLLGRGGLAKVEGDWDVQFVDLPPFTSAESAAFLRTQAGDQAAVISDDIAAALHSAAHGLPGPLLDALAEVSTRVHRKAARGDRGAASPGGLPAWQWLLGGVIVILLSAALIFQDRINALFEPAGSPIEQADSSPIPKPVAEPILLPDAVRPNGRIEREPDVQARLSARPTPAPSIELPALNRPEAGAADAAMPLAPAAQPSADDALSTLLDPSEAVADSAGDDLLDALMRDAEQVRPPPTLNQAASAAVDGPLAEVPAADAPMAGRLPQQLSEKRSAVQPPSAAAPPGDKPTAEAASVPPAAPKPQASGPKPQTQRPVAADLAATVPAAAAVEARSVSAGPRPTMPPPSTAPSIETAPTGQARDLPARPAPVEERAAPRSSKPATPAPRVAVEPRAPVLVSPAAAFDGAAWLASRTARRYTLQLVGGRNHALVEKFVRDHAIAPPYAVFERPLDGRPWYSLVAGDYPDRDAAVAARDRLPARLGSKGVWPRTFGSIQNP